MPRRILIRLSEPVREILERDAKANGVKLATYLRELATEHAREVRRAQIRAQTARVAAYLATSPEAQEFHDDIGNSAPIVD